MPMPKSATAISIALNAPHAHWCERLAEP